MDCPVFRSELQHSLPYNIPQQNHALPDKQLPIRQPTTQTTAISISKKMPTAKGTLHFRCTYLDCGQEFDNCDELATHLMQTHENNLTIQGHVRKDSGGSENSSSTMDVDHAPTTIKADVKQGMTKIDNEVKENGRMPMVFEWSIKKDSDMAEGMGVVGKFPEARPMLRKRTSKMSRNALANPGVSQWKTD